MIPFRISVTSSSPQYTIQSPIGSVDPTKDSTGLARPVTLGLRLQMSVRATTQHPTFNPKMMKTGRHRCILRLSGIRLHDPPAGNGRPKSVTLGSRLQWYLRRGYFQGSEQSGRSIFDVLMWLPETVYKTYTNPSTSILGYRSGKAL